MRVAPTTRPSLANKRGARYHAARLRTGEAEVASAALFEVTGTDDAREAVEAVERNETSSKASRRVEAPEQGQGTQHRRPRRPSIRGWRSRGCLQQPSESLGAQIRRSPHAAVQVPNLSEPPLESRLKLSFSLAERPSGVHQWLIRKRIADGARPRTVALRQSAPPAPEPSGSPS